MTMLRPLISAKVRSTARRSAPWKSRLIGWPVKLPSAAGVLELVGRRLTDGGELRRWRACAIAAFDGGIAIGRGRRDHGRRGGGRTADGAIKTERGDRNPRRARPAAPASRRAQTADRRRKTEDRRLQTDD